MKIYLAREAGFCFGVKLAMEMARKTKASIDKPLFTFGPLIHNPQVIEGLEKEDIRSVTTLEELREKDHVLIRSHGVPPEIYAAFEEKLIFYTDATCPYVKKVHEIVQRHARENHQILIVGDPSHPEIIAVKGWSGGRGTVVEEAGDLQGLSLESRVVVVAQTTLIKDRLDRIIQALTERGVEVEVYNTICRATASRQEAALALAKTVDLMIVIGGKHSSNTKKLFEIARKNGKNALHIETQDEFLMKDLKKYDKIGITAGASTPDWIIDAVVRKLEIEGEGILMNDNSEMNELMEQFDENYNVPRTGKSVEGKIVLISKDELIVNIGYKADGIIPREEISDAEDLDLNTEYEVNQTIEAVVIKKDNGEGNVLLSIKRIAQKQKWDELEEKFNDKETVTVKVNKEVKGGLTAYYEQIKGFIPASHVDVRYIENLAAFAGQELQVEVIELNRRKNKAVFSRKNVLQREIKATVEKAWENLEVGAVVKGIVRRFTDFGAFVDLGGVDGLLHVSEISWGKVNKPQDVLKKNQEIDVKILDLNREDNKVSLSIKQMMENPWKVVAEKYTLENEYDGTITGLTDFGAFVELEPGLEGLVHVSQIAVERVEKPSDLLKVGETVKVRILEINTEDNRIKLTMKPKEAPKKPEARVEKPRKKPEKDPVEKVLEELKEEKEPMSAFADEAFDAFDAALAEAEAEEAKEAKKAAKKAAKEEKAAKEAEVEAAPEAAVEEAAPEAAVAEAAPEVEEAEAAPEAAVEEAAEEEETK